MITIHRKALQQFVSDQIVDIHDPSRILSVQLSWCGLVLFWVGDTESKKIERHVYIYESGDDLKDLPPASTFLATVIDINRIEYHVFYEPAPAARVRQGMVP